MQDLSTEVEISVIELRLMLTPLAEVLGSIICLDLQSSFGHLHTNFKLS
jgi:hypothetical protein